MSFLSRVVDRALPPSAALREAREEADGVTEETDSYTLLNHAADTAVRQLPRGQRWRTFGGADGLLRDRTAARDE